MALPQELEKPGRIAFATIRRLIEQQDLEVRWHTLEFVRDHGSRIRPGPDDEWLRDELFRYYVDCILAGLEGHDTVHNRHEAAGGIVPLFEWLISGNAGGEVAAERVAARITELFRSKRELQDCIETGFLEHVLEVPDAIPYFEHWEHDPMLADSYRHALAWGKAHARRLARR